MYNVCFVKGFNGRTGDYDLECIDFEVLDLEVAKEIAKEYAEDGDDYCVTDADWNIIFEAKKGDLT